MVNEQSVFESLKFDCTSKRMHIIIVFCWNIINHGILIVFNCFTKYIRYVDTFVKVRKFCI